jgi:aldose 1-epimerase
MGRGPGYRLVGERVACEVLALGASLHRLEVKLPDGSWQNLVLSRPDLNVEDGSHFGATAGRVANRIDRARFTLDGVEYPLPANEDPHHLHGGPEGFAYRKWELARATESEVELRLVSPDGDQGYPGRLEVTAEFSLIPDGAQVVYTATTDVPTVVNLATHPYFALGDAFEDHMLTVPASRYAPTRPDHLPTGDVAAVEGTAIDFRRGRALGEALAAAEATGLARGGGLNHSLVVDGRGLREHARLTSPSGITVQVRSDAPTVLLYSGEHLGRAGLAIEAQGYVDAPNHPSFDSIELRPGQPRVSRTQWLVTIN